MVRSWPETPEPQPLYSGVEWFDGLGWLAYGLDANGQAGIWISEDGVAWSSAKTPLLLANVGQRVMDVTRGQVGNAMRYVAIARPYAWEALAWYVQDGSSVLVSDDGWTWFPAESTPGGDTALTAVTAWQSGFVAIGIEDEWPSNKTERVDGRVWMSVDGTSWTEQAPPELIDAFPMGLDVLGADTLVAVGAKDEVGVRKFAWTSRDGVSWAESEIVGFADLGSVYVASDATAQFAVMVGLSDQPYAALSRDGREWTVGALPDYAIPSGVDAHSNGAMAVGTNDPPDQKIETYVWVLPEPDSDWLSVDWQAHLPADGVNELAPWVFIDVATDGQRTLVLSQDGRVILAGL
jgi:hypothetical protein